MKKIVLIGDWCVDITILVKVSRLCPEAPVPIAVPISRGECPGMVGNVYVNLLSISGYTSDRFLIYRPSEHNVKTRYVDEATGYIMLRVDNDYKNVYPFDSKGFIKLANNSYLGENISAIVMSDYGKGFLTKLAIQEVSEWARKNSIPTFLDTKFILGDWSKDIFCVKINQKEYEATCLEKPFPHLLCRNLVVTLADKGSLVFDECGSKIEVPTRKVNVSDVCGAGDTMLAALVLKYTNCSDLIESVTFANQVASFAVSKRGVYAVKQQDLRKLKLSL
jgi:bifunctional ADP-heptose synthase (sugar kinase/adenylyltransferase)